MLMLLMRLLYDCVIAVSMELSFVAAMLTSLSHQSDYESL